MVNPETAAWDERRASRSAHRRLPPYPSERSARGNDLIALGCYDVFAERGIDCPRDVSVVGFNDMPFIDKLRPPLTSVRVPHYEVGAEAARMLLDGLRDPNRHARSMLLPLSLVDRQSTAAPARSV